jgi:phospholipase/carboxylesterase
VTLHEGEPTLAAGAQLAGARAAVVALHGRGAGAQDILALARAELGLDGVALLAPQARHASWYPASFLAPFAANEPWLSSALARVAALVAEIEAAGVPAERILLFGFSQGACLASDFVARNPRRYGGLVAATGGRIGPPGTRFASAGDLAGTPVHLAAGDPDPHVPWSRVEETAANLRAMGAEVTVHREPGFPHAVHPEARAFARQRIAVLSVAAGPT